ncbi:hypothetical protein AB0J83_47705, partial [Actinoplanes sp. NPDC049596]
MTYPTAPPWALPPDPPEGAPAAPWTPPGRLLVAYPEEMDPTARPEPPSWLPVIFWTLIGIVPGVLSAVGPGRGAPGRRPRRRADVGVGLRVEESITAPDQ